MSEKHSALVERMIGGDRTALAKLITIVEGSRRDASGILKMLGPASPGSYALGITGPPGGGKSTLLNRLTSALRGKDKKVGIIAVDPTSPFTGGAVLGDRIRMLGHSGDSSVFIRSLGSRGTHGGLSRATGDIMKLYGAFGMDYAVIETVGVGQTELDIIELADTVCVVLVPEAGDGIQAMKAGLMEIGDIFVVNKADRQGAQRLSVELRHSLSLVKSPGSWEPPVLLTTADRGEGTEELLEAIEKHADFQTNSGELKVKRNRRLEKEFLHILMDTVTDEIESSFEEPELSEILIRVKSGELNPYEGADVAIKKMFRKP
ncbi:MAG: methylmalonyl Co-A mutase-associated GTPase MeaB [Candidatus Dadabacteria bacterium]|nr:methylmalonyl Co-A mutase-associated GTPase MeaB [Candidatus Dadabacteria bacterium]